MVQQAPRIVASMFVGRGIKPNCALIKHVFADHYNNVDEITLMIVPYSVSLYPIHVASEYILLRQMIMTF